MRTLALYFLTLTIFLGCASQPQKQAPYQTRLYEGSYDEVWLAALRALADYPLKISNKDSGKIFTEVINGPYNDLMFAYPDQIDLPERYRFSIKLNFARLVSEENKPVTRIRIIKDLEKYRDFYAGWLDYQTDGIEEKIILYRVEHLLQMEKTMSKASESN